MSSLIWARLGQDVHHVAGGVVVHGDIIVQGRLDVQVVQGVFRGKVGGGQAK